MRLVAALAVALAAAGCAGAEAAPPTRPGQARDVRLFAQGYERIHPAPFHAVTRTRFRRVAADLARRAPRLDRDRFLVEVMRLAALAGERDGHTGVFPLDPGHRRTLHLYPIRLYDFPEGLFVVGEAGRLGLVGSRLVAIAGRPVEEVVRAVAPLVPRDNAWSRRARVPLWLVTAEVLRGLGVTGSTFTFERPDGTRMDTPLRPLSAARWRRAFPDVFHAMVPLGLPRARQDALWSERLPGGGLYVAYNAATVDTSAVADELRRLDPSRVVVDLRHNPGGNVHTSEPLLAALEGRRVVVLTSRTTFSAAQIFAVRLEQAGATFVGEPTGGSPNLWGDPVHVALPASGLAAHVAGLTWATGGSRDRRLALEPDLRVDLTAADFFAGRDPALEAALSRPQE